MPKFPVRQDVHGDTGREQQDKTPQHRENREHTESVSVCGIQAHIDWNEYHSGDPGPVLPDANPESLLAEDQEEGSKKRKQEKILTGIDVIANPPGKKIKYLNALSGGERTLTSIALICAILHDNPSPFVVLDEVEAALDEANTQRFVRIMAELSSHSQFIIITHNRVTMHATDALYGVVMNRDGMSKVLSVKLEDIKQHGEDVSIDKKA
jgi:ABC-type dipeptide/oligopeptide/nickel transport system ATPase subunit